MIYEGQIIKNIVFDLGGVILNIDYQLPVRAFERLGIQNFHHYFSKASQQAFLDEYETGKISSEVFLSKVLSLLPYGTEKSRVIDAWNSILLDLPEERLYLLERAVRNHRIFLLSNTNQLHIDCFEQYLQKQYNIHQWESHFEKVYYSYRIGMRKPDLEIFQHVLNDAGLNPSETLFIDDSIQHIQGARQCGIISHHLDDSDLIAFLSDKI